jgi:hypothetical protein
VTRLTIPILFLLVTRLDLVGLDATGKAIWFGRARQAGVRVPRALARARRGAHLIAARHEVRKTSEERPARPSLTAGC